MRAKAPPTDRFGGMLPFQHHKADPGEYFGNKISGADQFMSQDKFFVQKRAGSEYRAPILQHKMMHPNQSPSKRPGLGSVSPSRHHGPPEKDPDVWDPPTPPTKPDKHKVTPSAFNANQRPA